MVKRCDTCGFDKTDGCACYWDRLEEVFYGKKPTPRKIIEVASEAVNEAVAQIEREREEYRLLHELSKKEADSHETRIFLRGEKYV